MFEKRSFTKNNVSLLPRCLAIGHTITALFLEKTNQGILAVKVQRKADDGI